MTDTVPGASSLIGPATAADPAIEQAAARRAALIGDPEWRDRYLSGDPKARAEFSELHNTLAPVEAEAPGRARAGHPNRLAAELCRHPASRGRPD